MAIKPKEPFIDYNEAFKLYALYVDNPSDNHWSTCFQCGRKLYGEDKKYYCRDDWAVRCRACVFFKSHHIFKPGDLQHEDHPVVVMDFKDLGKEKAVLFCLFSVFVL